MLPVLGSTEYHEMIGKLELKLGRKLCEKELRVIRKECKKMLPRKGQGKTRGRYHDLYHPRKAITKNAKVGEIKKASLSGKAMSSSVSSRYTNSGKVTQYKNFSKN